MTASVVAQYGANPAEAYANTFVPSIAEPVMPQLLERAALRPGERVLDVACGTGVVARAAAAQVGPTGEVAGIDVTQEMLQVAAATSEPSGVAIDWRQAEAGSVPYPDGSFDAVLCQLGLMFFPDRTGALAEMRRVLCPGGRAVVSTPGPIPPVFAALDRALAEHVHPDLGGFVRTIFSVNSADGLADLIDHAGFEDAAASEYRVRLRLPEPREFLWQYVASTPLSPAVGSAPGDARDRLEADLVERWRSEVEDGHLVCDLTMILGSGSVRGR